MPTVPIAERLRAAYRPGIPYHAFLAAVFPREAYPRAYRSASHGGPPGCAMAFGAALRRHGYRVALNLPGRPVYRA